MPSINSYSGGLTLDVASRRRVILNAVYESEETLFCKKIKLIVCIVKVDLLCNSDFFIVGMSPLM